MSKTLNHKLQNQSFKFETYSLAIEIAIEALNQSGVHLGLLSFKFTEQYCFIFDPLHCKVPFVIRHPIRPIGKRVELLSLPVPRSLHFAHTSSMFFARPSSLLILSLMLYNLSTSHHCITKSFIF